MNDQTVSVTIYKYGIGSRETSNGEIGVRSFTNEFTEPPQPMIEISIGRGRNSKVAWGRMSHAKAHELAQILCYLTGNSMPCDGGEIKHTSSISVRITLDTNACAAKTKDFREKVIAGVDKELKKLGISE